MVASAAMVAFMAAVAAVSTEGGMEEDILAAMEDMAEVTVAGMAVGTAN